MPLSNPGPRTLRKHQRDKYPKSTLRLSIFKLPKLKGKKKLKRSQVKKYLVYRERIKIKLEFSLETMQATDNTAK